MLLPTEVDGARTRWVLRCLESILAVVGGGQSAASCRSGRREAETRVGDERGGDGDESSRRWLEWLGRCSIAHTAAGRVDLAIERGWDERERFISPSPSPLPSPPREGAPTSHRSLSRADSPVHGAIAATASRAASQTSSTRSVAPLRLALRPSRPHRPLPTPPGCSPRAACAARLAAPMSPP